MSSIFVGPPIIRTVLPGGVWLCYRLKFVSPAGTRRRSIRHGSLVSLRPPVDFLYSLYDALVSINVPSDKARAVVDAMERDMGTTLATKQDLESRFELLRRDMENRFALVDQRFGALESRIDQKFAATYAQLDQKIDGTRSLLEQKIASMGSQLEQKIESMGLQFEQKIESMGSQLKLAIDAQEHSMVIKLGSMLMLGFGLVIAALSLWS